MSANDVGATKRADVDSLNKTAKKHRMKNRRGYYEGINNGAIFDNIELAMGVLARRKLDEDDKGRMLALSERALGISIL